MTRRGALSDKDLKIVDLMGRINSLEIIGKRYAARIPGLEAALREVGKEVAFVGCEGADDDVCVNTTRAKEDWCPYCRIGNIIHASLSPATVTHAAVCDTCEGDSYDPVSKTHCPTCGGTGIAQIAPPNRGGTEHG